MLSSFRHLRRRRVSIGPQSEADAREYLANREQMRKEGRSVISLKRKKSRRDLRNDSNTQPPPSKGEEVSSPVAEETPEQAADIATIENQKDVSKSSLEVNAFDTTLLTPPPSDAGASSDSGREDEKSDRGMFSALEKPRTHYDVEVITKLVVYAGKSSVRFDTCRY